MLSANLNHYSLKIFTSAAAQIKHANSLCFYFSIITLVQTAFGHYELSFYGKGLCKSCSFQIFNSWSSFPPDYGIEHPQCVPPSEYSEPSFITESYQTLHPISSEDLLSLKYESEYPNVILRDAPLNPLQGDYFSVKQEVVSPDNMCVGRISRGEYGPKVMCFDAFETASSCKIKFEGSLNGLGDKSEFLSS